MDIQQSFVKVQFYEADVGYENIWASAAEGPDAYIIESVPFFVYDISLKDIVLTKRNEETGVISYKRMLSKSGHKTVRARPDQFILDSPDGKAFLSRLRSLGCEFETLPPRLVAIDVPSDLALKNVIGYLTDAAIPWEYADQSADL
ncbi:MAG TPA: DUF4265 domain-containing protein [Bryobacteraceae bacterium]|nr:DUF4265 domain-containing protein [Bryobacteraceae bacterium]